VKVNQRIKLTADIHTPDTAHKAGQQGTVRAVHADGSLTVRMDDGRTNFPQLGEYIPVDTTPLDPREAAWQILGDDYGTYSSDWHQALETAAATWDRLPPTTADVQPAA